MSSSVAPISISRWRNIHSLSPQRALSAPYIVVFWSHVVKCAVSYLITPWCKYGEYWPQWIIFKARSDLYSICKRLCKAQLSILCIDRVISRQNYQFLHHFGGRVLIEYQCLDTRVCGNDKHPHLAQYTIFKSYVWFDYFSCSFPPIISKELMCFASHEDIDFIITCMLCMANRSSMI